MALRVLSPPWRGCSRGRVKDWTTPCRCGYCQHACSYLRGGMTSPWRCSMPGAALGLPLVLIQDRHRLEGLPSWPPARSPLSRWRWTAASTARGSASGAGIQRADQLEALMTAACRSGRVRCTTSPHPARRMPAATSPAWLPNWLPTAIRSANSLVRGSPGADLLRGTQKVTVTAKDRPDLQV